MQGIYQGNGAGPVIWAVVSSPVLQILRPEGFGAFFKATLSGDDIRLVGYAFVDDTDLIQTACPLSGSISESTRCSHLLGSLDRGNRWCSSHRQE
jgi:hypothetical protein